MTTEVRRPVTAELLRYFLYLGSLGAGRAGHHVPVHTVTFDGRRPVTVRDETFPGPGAVGVWARADRVTELEEFRDGG